MARVVRLMLLLLLVLLLALPWLIIAQQMLAEQHAQAIELLPARQAILVSDLVPQSCEWAALNISGSPAERVDRPEERVLASATARTLADRAIRDALDVSGEFQPSHVYGPVLLRATLLDGGSRLVWARVWSTYPADRDAVVYLDAVTGEPLVIYRGMYLGDPWFDNGCALFDWEQDFFNPQTKVIGAVTWDVLLLLLLGIAAGIVWVFRRVRRIRAA